MDDGEAEPLARHLLAFKVSGQVVRVADLLCWRHLEGRSCFRQDQDQHSFDVVIVPVAPRRTSHALLEACEAAQAILSQEGLSVAVESSTKLTPGAKFNKWEAAGVPVRVELGSREVEQGSCTVAVHPAYCTYIEVAGVCEALQRLAAAQPEPAQQASQQLEYQQDQQHHQDQQPPRCMLHEQPLTQGLCPPPHLPTSLAPPATLRLHPPGCRVRGLGMQHLAAACCSVMAAVRPLRQHLTKKTVSHGPAMAAAKGDCTRSQPLPAALAPGPSSLGPWPPCDSANACARLVAGADLVLQEEQSGLAAAAAAVCTQLPSPHTNPHTLPVGSNAATVALQDHTAAADPAPTDHQPEFATRPTKESVSGSHPCNGGLTPLPPLRARAPHPLCLKAHLWPGCNPPHQLWPLLLAAAQPTGHHLQGGAGGPAHPGHTPSHTSIAPVNFLGHTPGCPFQPEHDTPLCPSSLLVCSEHVKHLAGLAPACHCGVGHVSMQQLQAEVEALYSSRSGSARLVWLPQQVVPGSRAAASQRRRQAVGCDRRQQPRPAAPGVGKGQGQACQVQAGQLGMEQHPGQQAQVRQGLDQAQQAGSSQEPGEGAPEAEQSAGGAVQASGGAPIQPGLALNSLRRVGEEGGREEGEEEEEASMLHAEGCEGGGEGEGPVTLFVAGFPPACPARLVQAALWAVLAPFKPLRVTLSRGGHGATHGWGRVKMQSFHAAHAAMQALHGSWLELGQQQQLQQQGPETTRPKAIRHCLPSPASSAAPPSPAEAAAAVQVEAMDGHIDGHRLGAAAEGGAAAVGVEAGPGQQPGSAAGSEAAEAAAAQAAAEGGAAAVRQKAAGAAAGPEAPAAPSPPAPPLQPQWQRCRLLLTRSCGRRDALFSDVTSPVAAIELDPDRAADLLLNLRLRGLVPPPLAAGRARAVAGGGGGVDHAAACGREGGAAGASPGQGPELAWGDHHEGLGLASRRGAGQGAGVVEMGGGEAPRCQGGDGWEGSGAGVNGGEGEGCHAQSPAVPCRVRVLCGDSCLLLGALPDQDLVLLDPPWGGPGYHTVVHGETEEGGEGVDKNGQGILQLRDRQAQQQQQREGAKEGQQQSSHDPEPEHAGASGQVTPFPSGQVTPVARLGSLPAMSLGSVPLAELCGRLLGQGRARVVALKLPAKDISARCVELAEQVASEAARYTVAYDTHLDEDRGAA
ncbi:hypothetical protein QJQ45_019490, partial [Haematococcus lacustris]